MSLLRRFLLDRLGLIAVYYVNTLVVLLLVSLLLGYRGIPGFSLWLEVAYSLLLATLLLAGHLLFAWFRWAPFARQQERLLGEATEPEALINLPAPANADQEASEGLIKRLYGLFAAERLRYQEAHERHLSFINLWVHQMKTPVSAVSLVAQRAKTKEPGEVRQAMESVEEEAQKISEGLDMVLHMARLQDFALDYHIRRTDLLPVVRKVVNDRRKQFIRLSIFPEIQVEAQETWVLTDEKWLGFVVDQIIGNALKYAAQTGKPDQRLRILVKGSLELIIADEGPGIPPQDLPRVFEPFFTGENGRRFANATGIGLYLVKQVVDRLGHTIAITAAEGQGTTVTLSFVTTP